MKNQNFLKSFINALEGIFYASKYEKNFKTHFLIGTLILIFSFAIKLTILEMSLIVICIGIVLVAELFNTAIESAVDLSTEGVFYELAKVAKDTAAGGTLICTVTSAAVGFLIFIKQILNTELIYFNIEKYFVSSIFFLVVGIIFLLLNNKKKISKDKFAYSFMSIISDFVFSLLAYVIFFLCLCFSKNYALIFATFIIATLILHIRLGIKFSIYSILQNLSAVLISFFISIIFLLVLI